VRMVCLGLIFKTSSDSTAMFPELKGTSIDFEVFGIGRAALPAGALR
jgi:hypothetical protein